MDERRSLAGRSGCQPEATTGQKKGVEKANCLPSVQRGEFLPVELERHGYHAALEAGPGFAVTHERLDFRIPKK